MNLVDNASITELITRCGNSNDQKAWKEFVHRFHRYILLCITRHRRAYGFTSDEPEVISDLSQEIYLYLLANDRRALKEFRGDSEAALLTYLSRVVRSIVTDHVRRKGSKKRTANEVSLDEKVAHNQSSISLSDLIPAGEEFSPERMMDERLAPQQLRNLLMSVLSGNNAARDAIIFQLHILRGLSINEIAQLPTFAITAANVEIVIRRTREKLRVTLSKPN